MIEVSQHNTVRLLEMNDGKVNFLSHRPRTALLAALTGADNDPSVAAVVLAGRGSCFCAGMNIDDFESGSPPSPQHKAITSLLPRPRRV